MFFLLKSKRNALSINSINNKSVSDDEYKIIKLTFFYASFFGNSLGVAQSIYSHSDVIELRALAKDINMSVQHGSKVPFELTSN